MTCHLTIHIILQTKLQYLASVNPKHLFVWHEEHAFCHRSASREGGLFISEAFLHYVVNTIA